MGNNTYSFGRYFESNAGQRVLMSGYLGSIGFGYPAAIGAWAATEGERPIIAVTGDGGFGQYMGEILTAVKPSSAARSASGSPMRAGSTRRSRRRSPTTVPLWSRS